MSFAKYDNPMCDKNKRFGMSWYHASYVPTHLCCAHQNKLTSKKEDISEML